ncbi:MAG: ABC transporter ATP-binding protein [Arcobacter sp.]|nr:MAG: ABC transporter ATP-binding protein [Arcobacter sp.]
MSVKMRLMHNVLDILKEDKQNIFYLLYYSAIKSILVLSIPLASSFIINSVLSHASISVFVLGFVVISIYIFITFLRVVQEYIVEKFQQKIFVQAGIKISQMAVEQENRTAQDKKIIKKHMNYFFDVTSIQKLVPIVLLDGAGLLMKIFVSLILLLVFDPLLFISAIVLFTLYWILLLALGKNGIKYAIERSDAKHKSIYFLQNIPNIKASKEEILKDYDRHLNNYVQARQKSFSVIIKQLALTLLMEGIVLSGFLILGGYLVIEGSLPIGEFVAAEIIIVSIIYSLKVFVKQIDYMYEMVEGFNKLDKLSSSLGEAHHV